MSTAGASGSRKRYGQTYQRVGKAMKQAYKKVGVRSDREMLDLLNAPGLSINSRGRPSLQIGQFVWNTDKSAQQFSSPGAVYLFTCYPRGNNEGDRHSNKTNTYKMQALMHCALDRTMYPYNRKFKMYFWIVYDKSPSGSLPTTATIFKHYLYINAFGGVALVNIPLQVTNRTCNRISNKRYNCY
jgi:hypothetical protein